MGKHACHLFQGRFERLNAGVHNFITSHFSDCWVSWIEPPREHMFVPEMRFDCSFLDHPGSLIWLQELLEITQVLPELTEG